MALVDFTAAYCATCKGNKARALDNRMVRNMLKELNVATFQGDYTSGDVAIAEFLQKHDRPGVPLNLIYPAGRPDAPIVLSPHLTAGDVLNNLGIAQSVGVLPPGGLNQLRVRLLFAPAGPEEPDRAALAACERLTIEEYRGRGVEVLEVSPADFEKWLEGPGKPYAAAHVYMQYVALAKERKADAVGGLSTFEVTPEMAKGMGADPGVYFKGWHVSLSGCSHNFVWNMEGGNTARAIPLNHRFDGGDPWEIPTTVEPRSCSASAMSPMEEMNKGRPFVGVGLDGTKVTLVRPDSPAEAAGLQLGDLLTSFHGREVAGPSTLSEALADMKPGDEVELKYDRAGRQTVKRVKLVDRAELEARQSPLGKPLPELIGTDIDGKDVRLSEFKGKIVVLDFWATWCGPCLEEMPLLQLTWDRLKDQGLVWVSVSVDEDDAAWRKFVKDNHLGGIQLRNRDWETQVFVNSYPTTYLIDRDGTVKCRLRGETIGSGVAAALGEK